VSPERGSVHRITCRGSSGGRARALGAIVLSEDAWNRTMNAVVIAPIYPGSPQVPVFHIAVAGGYADVSRTQSIAIDDLAPTAHDVPKATLERVARAAVDFLDLPSLIAREVRRPPAGRYPAGHPQQRGVYWTDLGVGERKRVCVLTPDEHNRVAAYSTTLRLASRDKPGRRDGQVPCEGGWIITGDLIIRPHGLLDHRRRPRPNAITRAGMREVAQRVQKLLGVS
jgi:mRNA-degrading endonuclease toxin of MazEF toxin-antitoxin module